MLFKLEWINQYVDLKDKSISEIHDALNSMGLEVESHKALCQGTNIVSAKVVKKEKHPNADKLNLCQVDIGKEQVQIVCGAQNFKEGDSVIVSLPGSVLPGNFKIKQSEIRGEVSNGMICSLKELGYPEELLSKEASEGIHVIDTNIETGREDVLNVLSLDDYVFEIAITPNRADWNSVYEIAKEFAVYFDKPIKNLEKSEVKFELIDNLIEEEAASGFTITKITGLSQGKPNQKIINYISTSGVKSISPLVDLGNYLFLETGQPNHLYDASKIKGEIKVKKGLEGTFEALDDQKYNYTKSDIVIIDDSGVIGLAGIIGSKSTMVDEKTTSVFLEVGNFDATTIRKTSQRIQLSTRAAMRFSKGISTDVIKPFITRAAYTFAQEFGGKVESCKISGKTDVPKTKIKFDFNSIEKYLGFNIEKETTTKIFKRLGFELKGEFVLVPAYRIDMTIYQDLIEELARVYGYEKLESKFSSTKPSLVLNSDEHDFISNVKKIVSRKNFNEVITYSLVTTENANNFALYENNKLATLSKPLSQDRATMRQSVISSLIDVAKYNIDRGAKDISIFEVSSINNQNSSYNELSLLQYNNVVEDSLYDNVIETSFFSLKTYVQSIMSDLGINDNRYQFGKMEENDFYNHFASANIYINKELVGRVGQVHPAISAKSKMKNIFVAQLNLNSILSQKTSVVKAKEFSQMQSVFQDYTIDISKDTNVESILKLARKSSKLILDIKITSIYTGENISSDMKALTIKVEYNNPKETIKDEEIKDFRNSFIELAKKEGFEFRG